VLLVGRAWREEPAALVRVRKGAAVTLARTDHSIWICNNLLPLPGLTGLECDRPTELLEKLSLPLGMVAEAAELAGLGLDVVRAALDSERHTHASENRALRRAARAWKTRAETLDDRLRAAERELEDVRAESKAALLARDSAEAELLRVQSECSTLRGFKRRILASIESGTLATVDKSVVGREAIKSASPSGASPCGTVVGGGSGERRRSVTASDKVRNWAADDAVCAEEQELARKVDMMRDWGTGTDVSSGAGSSSRSTSTVTSSARHRSLTSTPLSPVRSTGTDQGWGQLLDCSAADSAFGALDASSSSSQHDSSVGESGAATRHSTDASAGPAWDGKTWRDSINPDDPAFGVEAMEAASWDNSGRARRWVQTSVRSMESGSSEDGSPSVGRRRRAKKQLPGSHGSRSSGGVAGGLQNVLTELEKKAEALQEAEEQRSADRREFDEALHDNARLQTQLERAQQEIQQVRSVNEHLVESVNAVRIELRGTPGSAMRSQTLSMAATPAVAAAATAAAAAAAVPVRLGVGGGDDDEEEDETAAAFSPRVAATRRRLASPAQPAQLEQNEWAESNEQQRRRRRVPTNDSASSASSAAVREQNDEADAEGEVSWQQHAELTVEQGSSLSIAATPPSPEAAAKRARASRADQNNRGNSGSMSGSESEPEPDTSASAFSELRGAGRHGVAATVEYAREEEPDGRQDSSSSRSSSTSTPSSSPLGGVDRADDSASEQRQRRRQQRKGASRSQLSEIDQSVLEKAAAVELRRRASLGGTSAVDTSSSSSSSG
jgi:hypothetical protein